MREFIEFLKNPDMFASLGGRPTKGVLLSGPPGTGKTMLARAIAGEAGVPFFYASGSEFEDTLVPSPLPLARRRRQADLCSGARRYVGVGAMRIRQMFKVAKERAPSIIFIDELDSIGSKRSDNDGENRVRVLPLPLRIVSVVSLTPASSSLQGPSASGGGGADASKRQTLNELLAQLDGFSSDEDVIVVACVSSSLLIPARRLADLLFASPSQRDQLPGVVGRGAHTARQIRPPRPRSASRYVLRGLLAFLRRPRR